MSNNDIISNPLHKRINLNDDDEGFVEESLESAKATSSSATLSRSHAVKAVDKHSHSHDDHDAPPPPTRVPEWMGDYIEHVFKLRKRNTTAEQEIYYGIIQFISCLYVLPVVPFQMKRVGYDETASIVATSVTCAIGSIVAAFFTDMPFIIAPPTSVSIFLAVSMQQQGLKHIHGNTAVMFSGLGLAIVGAVPPLAKFVAKCIPDSIQAACGVGIGLITALAGCTEINLVVRGKYTIVDMGPITDEVAVAICALVIVAAMLHYHVKGAFCSGLIFGTFVWWIISGEWPEGVAENPKTENDHGDPNDHSILLLIFNLLFLYILTLNGLARSLSDLAKLTKKSGAIPRGNFLLICCGCTTILSGYMSGPPILISPESAAGIKAGAKTGLSTLVCGILFGIATFFYPIFAAVPAAGTAPLLIMVGVMLFANVRRIDWTSTKDAVPAYCVLFFIPFTYSILRGVAFGYVIYIFLGFFTGEMITNTQELITSYTNPPPKPVKVIHEDEEHLEDSKFLGSEMLGKLLNMSEMDAHDIAVEHM